MKEKKKRTPTLVEAIIVLLLVIVAIIGSNQLGAEMQLALFLGAFVALISCLYFRVPWENTQSTVLKSMADMMIPIIILMDVGIMVGAWIIGGTVPSLMYYGLKIVSPMLILPITFLCCMIMSVFTGTSFGSIATMGLAFTGVAIGAGVPVPMVVGAAVSGSWFGDKMSPMSDSVNLISAVTGISLYSHIGSMMFTSVPAAVVVFIIYTVMSISTSSGNASLDQIDTMMADLAANFDISIIALIPAVLMLVVSVMKIPAILGLSGVAIFSIFFAMFMQGESLGGSVVVINGLIQYGSKLNWSFANNGNESVVLKSLQLIGGNGYEGNLMDVNVEVNAHSSVAYATTVGLLGIVSPVTCRFWFEYNGEEYFVDAVYN